MAYVSVWGAPVAFVFAGWNHWNNPLGLVGVGTARWWVGSVAAGLEVAAFWLIAAGIAFAALAVTAEPDESE